MELQIGTSQAQSSLAAIEKSLSRLEASLLRFGRGETGFDDFSRRLANLRRVDPAVANSIRDLANAAQQLSRGSDFSRLIRDAGALSKLGFQNAARGVESFNAALARIRVPQQVLALDATLRSIAQSSRLAASGVNELSTALRGAKVPLGVQALPNQLRNVTAEAVRVTEASRGMAQGFGSVSSALAALGIATGGAGLVQLVKSSTDAYASINQLRSSLTALGGEQFAAANLKLLATSANETGQSMQTLLPQFRQFVTAATSIGQNAGVTAQTWQDFSIAARGAGLNSEQFARAITAMTQVLSKGKLTAEEMTGQLAEAFPGATAIAARSIGQTVPAFLEMIKAGEVGTDILAKFAAQARQEFGGAVAAQMDTVASAANRLQSALFMASAEFGRGFELAAPGINALASALNIATGSGQSLAFTLGQIAGVVVGGLAQGVAWLVQTWQQWRGVLTAIAGMAVGSMLAGWVGSILNIAGGALKAGQALLQVGVAAYSIRGAAAAIDFIGVAFNGLKIAINAAMTALGPLRLALIGIGAAVAVGSVVWDQYSKSVATSAEASDRAADGADSAADAVRRLQEMAERMENSASGLTNGLYDMASGADAWRSGAASASVETDALANSLTRASAASASFEMPDFSARRSDSGYSSGYTTSAYDALGMPNDFQAWKSASLFNEPSLFDGWARGGIVGAGKSPMQVRARASDFIGAPHFADGGVTGGGIPSILHPGEAVVPLAGGAIPVQFTGGGFGAASGMSTLARDSAQTLSMIEQRIINNGVIIKNEADRHYAVHTEILRTLQDIQKRGSLGSGTGTSTTVTDTVRDNGLRTIGGGSSLPSSTWENPFNRTGSPSQGGARVSWGLPVGVPAAIVAKHLNPGESVPDLIKRMGGEQDFPSFNSGSPNVNAGSGMLAALHGDEAVIPLPDGRCVPVELRGMGHIQPANSGSGNVINLTMHVHTKDADSFRRSQGQIMRELRNDLDAAARTLGDGTARYDDPTRRSG